MRLTISSVRRGATWQARSGLLVLVAATLISWSTPVAASDGDPSRHPSGIDIVGALSLQSTPSNELQSRAYWQAWEYAEMHGSDVGYPWIDGASGLVHIRAASSQGRALLQTVRTVGALATLPVDIEDVEYSFADLEAIRGDIAARFEARDPLYMDIAKTAPDEINNRIIVTTRDATDGLLADLADRYGTVPVAVRELPGFRPYATAGGRQHDYSPFYGGAKIYPPGLECTSAFAWTLPGGGDGMLTAAHCVPNGGRVNRPTSAGGELPMGTVTAWDEENWMTEAGTTYYTGEHTFKGDVALIRLDGGRESRARMYVGGPDSDTYKLVTAIWSRGPDIGDQYWMGGKTSGDVGIFEVNDLHVDVYYVNLYSTARNMTEGYKPNYDGCSNPGDSGGSVYTYRNDGSVAAKGTHSGAASIVFSCFEYFTDIRLSDTALPGTVKLAS
jgi:hypothetical protein